MSATYRVKLNFLIPGGILEKRPLLRRYRGYNSLTNKQSIGKK